MGIDKIKKILFKITPSRIIRLYQEPLKASRVLPKFARLSYSQEGEDLILERFFENKKNGFYVDVGAHHPKRFSNTYIFYLKGWRGINIDAMPESMIEFFKERPKDINLEIGVSKEQKEMVYHMFNQPAINTFSINEAWKSEGIERFKIIDKKTIKTLPLKMILKEHLPQNTKIDFMSIDVEGLDLEVIQSNDWERFRPKIVLVEDLIKMDLTEIPKNNLIYQTLSLQGYELIAKTSNTLFFKDKRENES